MYILHRDSSIAQITPQQLYLSVSFLTYEQEPHVIFALTSVQARMKKWRNDWETSRSWGAVPTQHYSSTRHCMCPLEIYGRRQKERTGQRAFYCLMDSVRLDHKEWWFRKSWWGTVVCFYPTQNLSGEKCKEYCGQLHLRNYGYT